MTVRALGRPRPPAEAARLVTVAAARTPGNGERADCGGIPAMVAQASLHRNNIPPRRIGVKGRAGAGQLRMISSCIGQEFAVESAREFSLVSSISGIVGRLALAPLPDAAHRDQRVVELHPPLRVAVDRVVHIEDAGRFGDDTGFLLEFAHRPVGDRLAEFEDTAGKAPAPLIGLLRPLDDQRPDI